MEVVPLTLLTLDAWDFIRLKEKRCDDCGQPFASRYRLALGVLVFCLRSLADDVRWARAEPFVRIGFWGLNIGPGLMVAIDLFPAGVLQLWDALANG